MPETDLRSWNAEMIARFLAAPPEPYAEHRPVVRVIEVPGRRSGEPRPFAVNITLIRG
ncbi:hypothetical protein [Sciscionella sediminilitoris]|uniref:hypothetical protein n=1 Tax=Sciscionella sediminilitoris TaxID=1445613 RepID=UPI0012E22DF1|nr:hypothetical protein [Sciscionella sp. SE31]